MRRGRQEEGSCALRGCKCTAGDIHNPLLPSPPLPSPLPLPLTLSPNHPPRNAVLGSGKEGQKLCPRGEHRKHDPALVRLSSMHCPSYLHSVRCRQVAGNNVPGHTVARCDPTERKQENLMRRLSVALVVAAGTWATQGPCWWPTEYSVLALRLSSSQTNVPVRLRLNHHRSLPLHCLLKRLHLGGKVFSVTPAPLAATTWACACAACLPHRLPVARCRS
jgi:hypothetical protein